MKEVMIKVVASVLVIVGFVLIIGTVGADDYLVTQGKEGLPMAELMGKAVFGLVLCGVGALMVRRSTWE